MKKAMFAAPMVIAGSMAVPPLASSVIAGTVNSVASVHSTPIITCVFADGQSATVTLTKQRFTYQFGRNGVAEIRLVGDGRSGNLFKLVVSFPRAGWTQLRFKNGATSYILFHYYNLFSYVRNYEGVKDKSGLLVFQNGHRLAVRLCKSADGLDNGTNLTSLPDDAEDHSDDIIDDVERHH